MSPKVALRKQSKQGAPPKVGSPEEHATWLASRIANLTTRLPTILPSEWATSTRYLPPSVSVSPGFYSFEKTPYLKEILDNFAIDSPIREITLAKGAQLGSSTNAENVVGYCIDHLSSAPILWVTADQELATQRLQSSILPMIQASSLADKIKSNDEKNARKTGQTDRKIEWVGGGSLRPLGAQNANKFRQDSVQVLIRDEIDAWPETIGRDGDPLLLTLGRTAAFETSRKIYDTSTPTLKEQSKIWRQFLRGDARYYYIRCLKCGHHQSLRWRRDDPTTGETTGIVWDTNPETKQFIPGSVRYACESCGHRHRNEDKTKLLSPEFGAEWRPTKAPDHPTIRSYHLSALYSPVGMQSWESCVRLWLEAWDVENARPKDLATLQAFYNLVLGEPFELRGEKLSYEDVSDHKRDYKFGEVPNRWAAVHAGSPIQILTAAVDVQKDFLSVGVFGWTVGRRCFLIDYFRFDGETDQLENPATWGAVKNLIKTKLYTADDGKRYPITLTLVDSGWRPEVTYRFVAPFARGVMAIRGDHTNHRTKSGVLFNQLNTALGERAFGIEVDLYKERHHVALKHGWDGMGLMPDGHVNLPSNITKEQLKELTVERRVAEIDQATKQRKGWKWVRPSGSRNELWDLLVYASSGVDMLAWNYCRKQLQLNQVVWAAFWDLTQKGAYFTQAN